MNISLETVYENYFWGNKIITLQKLTPAGRKETRYTFMEWVNIKVKCKEKDKQGVWISCNYRNHKTNWRQDIWVRMCLCFMNTIFVALGIYEWFEAKTNFIFKKISVFCSYFCVRVHK